MFFRLSLVECDCFSLHHSHVIADAFLFVNQMARDQNGRAARRDILEQRGEHIAAHHRVEQIGKRVWDLLSESCI